MCCCYFASSTVCAFLFFFFFNDTATTEIYTLSLHDALPIYLAHVLHRRVVPPEVEQHARDQEARVQRQRIQIASPTRSSKRDRKSTRLNSSHGYISYAVFCLKKKKKTRSKQSCTQSTNRAQN